MDAEQGSVYTFGKGRECQLVRFSAATNYCPMSKNTTCFF